MPPQAAESFRDEAKKNPDGVIKDIERVVDRIDIEHASATFRSDREYVYKKVEATLGLEAMNSFCKEIVRTALIRFANLVGHATTERQAEWGMLFADLVERARNPAMQVPDRIEVGRAVAMMQRRMFSPESSEFQNATDLLREIAVTARRFYGPWSQRSSKLERQLPPQCA